jgi:hypothetical protein
MERIAEEAPPVTVVPPLAEGDIRRYCGDPCALRAGLHRAVDLRRHWEARGVRDRVVTLDQRALTPPETPTEIDELIAHYGAERLILLLDHQT